jgi:hypothetical protein
MNNLAKPTLVTLQKLGKIPWSQFSLGEKKAGELLASVKASHAFPLEEITFERGFIEFDIESPRNREQMNRLWSILHAFLYFLTRRICDSRRWIGEP